MLCPLQRMGYRHQHALAVQPRARAWIASDYDQPL
jgi:hypothetical protein